MWDETYEDDAALLAGLVVEAAEEAADADEVAVVAGVVEVATAEETDELLAADEVAAADELEAPLAEAEEAVPLADALAVKQLVSAVIPVR